MPLMPKRSKFRKMQKGRMRGNATIRPETKEKYTYQRGQQPLCTDCSG